MTRCSPCWTSCPTWPEGPDGQEGVRGLRGGKAQCPGGVPPPGRRGDQGALQALSPEIPGRPLRHQRGGPDQRRTGGGAGRPRPGPGLGPQPGGRLWPGRPVLRLRRPGRHPGRQGPGAHLHRGLFYDKEEIGSEGNTSARSYLLDEIVETLLERQGESPHVPAPGADEFQQGPLRPTSPGPSTRIFPRSTKNGTPPGWGTASASTSTAAAAASIPPATPTPSTWPGSGRSSGTHGVVWQAGQLGKVDEGGGGTIAKYLAVYGMEIIDCGTPLLSMHSPFEVASKADLYMVFKAYKAFFCAPGD